MAVKSMERKVKDKEMGLSAAAAECIDAVVFILILKLCTGKRLLLRLVCAAGMSRLLSSLAGYMLCRKRACGGSSGKSAARFVCMNLAKLTGTCSALAICAEAGDGAALAVNTAMDGLYAALCCKLYPTVIFRCDESQACFYGKLARAARITLCGLSARYTCDFEAENGVVYVCRHLNMHGPYTTIKWLPVDVHPMILSVYFSRDEAYRHMKNYTFSARWGRKPKEKSLLARCAGSLVYNVVASLRAVPVYRNTGSSIKTLREGLKYLKKGESLIVYPDVEYTAKYGAESEIYPGFLYLGEMYRRQTGKSLRFVPLYIDDRHRRIIAGEAVVADSREETAAAASKLRAAINGRMDAA